MDIQKWNVYSRISTIGETWTDPKDTPDNITRINEFVELFKSYLPLTSRVLCPGGMLDALTLADSGYVVHAIHPMMESVNWLNEKRKQLSVPHRLIASHGDGHDLDFPQGYFDGYFSVQVNEHWICPLIHIGEVRHCVRDGGIVFVDACGTKLSNPDNDIIWHTNLISEQEISDQWNYWGFREIWRGPLVGQLGETGGDNRPQLLFQKLPINDENFRHRKSLAEILRLRMELD